MLSRIKSLRISVKLTLVYAALMAALLFATAACTAVGLYYTQYHQVERELSFSILSVIDQMSKRYGTVEEHVTPTLPLPPPPAPGQRGKMGEAHHGEREGALPREELGEGHHGEQHDAVKRGEGFGFGAMSGGKRFFLQQREAEPSENMDFELFPGVFLKITDAQGDVVYDSDRYSPALSMLRGHVSEKPPFWANPNFQVIETDNFIIYYKEVPAILNGEAYTLHFFKTITAENRLQTLVHEILLAEMLCGIIVALFLGYFISRRMLNPVRELTAAARSIEISDLSTRIQVPSAKDELSELAETFNLMLDRIQKGFKQQQQFVSDASHELRTPVTVIRGYSDMLRNWGQNEPETLQEGLEAISSEAEDMQDLIEKLLFLARADQKRQIIKKEPVNMQILLEDVFKKLQMTDEKHEYQLLANEAATVSADKVTIKQMLWIFLENAIKYTPTGGKISLSSRLVKQGELELVIADTGIGIAPEEQGKIFHRFYRVDSSRSRDVNTRGGTGLGLSIARWIADEHGIKIELESELGKGAKFILRIPC